MAVININRNQFEEMVHSGKTVLVEFSAPWCVYCRRLAPALESVAEEYKDTLVFTAVNIDDEPELAEAEAIEVVPTLLIYHNGQALGSIVAPESRTQLVAFIEETLQHRTQEVNNAQHIYDMIVVGGGPGGYTAALYNLVSSGLPVDEIPHTEIDWMGASSYVTRKLPIWLYTFCATACSSESVDGIL